MNNIEVLSDLLKKRDYYRKDWKPNWNDDSVKYSITYYDTGKEKVIKILYNYNNPRTFTFKSYKSAKNFLKENKELIKQLEDISI